MLLNDAIKEKTRKDKTKQENDVPNDEDDDNEDEVTNDDDDTLTA